MEATPGVTTRRRGVTLPVMSSAAALLTIPATEADLLAASAGDRAFELIDGALVEKEANPRHSLGQSQLTGMLFPYHRRRSGDGPGGWWILTEALVRLQPHTVRPDLAGWRREVMPTLPADAIIVTRPDWVCEIVSPGHAREDMVFKRRLYRQHQVPHYWIIDPRDQTLLVLELGPRSYEEVLVAQRGDVVRAEPFSAVEIDVSALFDGDE